MIVDKKNIVFVCHLGDTDQLPGASCRPIRDKPHAVAILNAVFRERSTLAESVFSDDEERSVAVRRDHADYLIVFAQFDAVNTHRVSRSSADARFIETDRQPLARDEQDVVRIVR